jgi:hypothetical protein
MWVRRTASLVPVASIGAACRSVGAPNKRDTPAFDARDEQALQVFAASIGIILETWNEATTVRRARANVAGQPTGASANRTLTG